MVVAKVEVVGDAPLRGPRGVVEAERVLHEHVEAHALEAAGGAREARVHHLLAQAHRLEDLRALVALHRGDTHLGHHLEDAEGNGLLVLGHGRGRGHARLRRHGADGLVGHVGADAVRAVAHERGEVVYLLRVRRVHEQTHLGARLLLDEALVHGARGEQGGHRDARLGHGPVREHHQPLAVGHRGARLDADALDRLAERRAAVRARLRHVKGGVDLGGAPALVGGALDGGHGLEGEAGLLHHEALGRVRGHGEEVRLGAHRALERHD
mmetsp:Transcript_14354/g.42188  ORF Transcript_14354/g.42188 Transcript_14354/m.42188 type:complete len:268 (+) Transcript_14354:2563-3366(+)